MTEDRQELTESLRHSLAATIDENHLMLSDDHARLEQGLWIARHMAYDEETLINMHAAMEVLNTNLKLLKKLSLRYEEEAHGGARQTPEDNALGGGAPDGGPDDVGGDRGAGQGPEQGAEGDGEGP